MRSETLKQQCIYQAVASLFGTFNINVVIRTLNILNSSFGVKIRYMHYNVNQVVVTLFKCETTSFAK